jgi:MATE family multidrug resistance protein
MGRKVSGDVRRASVMTGIWAAVICAFMALAFALGGGWMIDLMTTAPEVRIAARDYLPYMVAAPLVGCAAWMLDGIFIGATRTVDMRNMMIVSTVIYFASVLPLMAAFGNHGLWLGLLLSFIVRGITLGMRYPALEAAAR